MEFPAARRGRITPQRRVILDILSAPDYHPTAEEVFLIARKVIPTISLGTIYRSLGYLRDIGRIREIRPKTGGGSRYEAMRLLHAHFHCASCSLVHDVSIPTPLASIGWGRDPKVGTVHSLEVHAVGLCSACAPPRVPSPDERA